MGNLLYKICSHSLGLYIILLSSMWCPPITIDGVFLHCPTETVGCPEIYWHASSQHWTASDAILEKLFTLLTHSAVPHLQWLLSHTSSCHAPACTDYLWINAWAWGREQDMNPPTVSPCCYCSNTLPDHQSANLTQIIALAIVNKAAYM